MYHDRIPGDNHSIKFLESVATFMRLASSFNITDLHTGIFPVGTCKMLVLCQLWHCLCG